MTTTIITKVCSICKKDVPLTGFVTTNKKTGAKDARCRTCFNRLRREYKIVINKLSDHVIQKFWSQVNKTDGCWIWTGSADDNGYGRFSIGYKAMLAHRFSAMLVNPNLPDELFVLHECDNPPCVRSDHFHYGNQARNVADMVERDRQAKGSNHSQAKLTETEVLIIRSRLDSGERQSAIAKEYSLNAGTVSRIASRDAWTHV